MWLVSASLVTTVMLTRSIVAHRTRYSKLRLELSCVFVMLAGAVRFASAATQEPPNAVELVLVGAAQTEHSLYDRVRSLFPPDTRFTSDARAELDPSAVLHPPIAGTLYLWITLNAESRARIYVTTREQDHESTRYFYRDVLLVAGLDEVGRETLAQVAHSSACALWERERQISRQLLVSAIEADATVQAAAATPNATRAASPLPMAPSAGESKPAAPPDSLLSRQAKKEDTSGAAQVGVILAAAYSTHASGGEGWLDQLGGSVTAVFGQQYSARAAAAYLAPQQFELSYTRVRLTGYQSELRLGWNPRGVGNFRPHLETGIGVLAARWSADSVSPATGQPGASQRRVFTVAAVGCEWKPSYVMLATRFELRIPFRETSYQVLGSTDNSRTVHSWLNPGFAIEVGFPLDSLF